MRERKESGTDSWVSSIYGAATIIQMFFQLLGPLMYLLNKCYGSATKINVQWLEQHCRSSQSCILPTFVVEAQDYCREWKGRDHVSTLVLHSSSIWCVVITTLSAACCPSVTDRPSLLYPQIVAAILAIAGIVMMTYADGFHSHSVIGITLVVASASMSALYKVF